LMTIIEERHNHEGLSINQHTKAKSNLEYIVYS
jgi:hypothetical protein